MEVLYKTQWAFIVFLMLQHTLAGPNLKILQMAKSTLKLCKVAQAQTGNMALMRTMPLPTPQTVYLRTWIFFFFFLSWEVTQNRGEPIKLAKKPQSSTQTYEFQLCRWMWQTRLSKLVYYQVCKGRREKANLIIEANCTWSHIISLWEK